jgi:hypothetical protein
MDKIRKQTHRKGKQINGTFKHKFLKISLNLQIALAAESHLAEWHGLEGQLNI